MKFFKKSDKNKGSSSASPAENPYAAAPASNYAPSIASAAPSYRSQDPNPPRISGNVRPGPGPGGPAPMRGQGPAPAQQQTYGNTSYGASGGYGSNQYGNSSGGYGGGASRGGYGSAQDNSRDQLMAGAKPVGSSYGGFQSNPYATNVAAAAPAPNGAVNPYINQVDPNGMPGGRQPYFDLTQEEDPDEREVKQIGNQILQEKSSTVDTTNRILALTSQIDAQGDNIMNSINRQEDMLDNYERNMDISNAKSRQAKAAVKDLATADHMFNFRTRGKRERELAEKTERDLMARRTEDETRNARHDRQRAYQEKMNNEANKNKSTFGRKPGNNKLSFDFDDEGFKTEDDQLEDQIDQNMDAIERAVGSINMKARMIGHQIDQSNQRLPGLTEKTDNALGTLQDTNHRLRQKMGQ